MADTHLMSPSEYVEFSLYTTVRIHGRPGWVGVNDREGTRVCTASSISELRSLLRYYDCWDGSLPPLRGDMEPWSDTERAELTR